MGVVQGRRVAIASCAAEPLVAWRAAGRAAQPASARPAAVPQSACLPSPRPQVYPERMAALPPRAFQTLLSTLGFGVGATGDEEVTQVRGPLHGALLQI